jgi:hypothetical protein
MTNITLPDNYVGTDTVPSSMPFGMKIGTEGDWY